MIACTAILFVQPTCIVAIVTMKVPCFIPKQPVCTFSMEDANDDSKMADLLSYFQQELTFQESSLKLCQSEYDVSQTHISGILVY